MNKCYIGRCECGCGSIVAAILEGSRPREETARIVGEWVIDGLSVETADAEQARVQFDKCRREEAM